ncbi:FCN1 [Branchiostoma lanceolatum]|uniref:FCN1 protein n=1 Tax=Branchiostoma lanceolatum TaxID=7740 RepID=A0A8K0A9G0_BRALA|nr:FCN1 [Branchiostoma lanceolatum]
MYDALMDYGSDPYAGEVQYDLVKEQFQKLGQQNGESLSGMTGDLTNAIKAMKDVWVLQYTDSGTGYEMAILLENFDPRTEFKPGFLDMAIDDFRSSVPEDMAAELNLDTFGYLYNEDLKGKGGTALLSMEGQVTETVIGFRDMWMLSYSESPDDMGTSILLENFDPTADELPDDIQLGDLSAFASYNERYLHNFHYRYMEMRQTVTSLQSVIPTNCGTALHSIRLDARFTLLRLPFFFMACWEIHFKEFLIIPIPCFEICIVCGIKVVIPMIKVLVIRREFWFGLWIWPAPAPCPWPPAPNPGTMLAFGNPTGLNHLDTSDCPPDPLAGFGAINLVCQPVFGWLAKRVCFYDCDFPGWVPCWGSFVRLCIGGVWTGSPLVCLPKWWIPFPPPPRIPRPPPGEPLLPCDCKDIHDMDPALPNGTYMVYPKDDQPGFLVYCDMDTDGGGWTVFQRRLDGSVDFYRGWDDYKRGFPSDMTGEFWLGNDKIHRLTAQKACALRVDLEAYDGNTTYAVYDSFSIDDEANNYTLAISGYSGTAGDAITAQQEGHNLDGQAFTTYDRDNDPWDENCAVRFMGAWWYCACHDSNLNGMYGNDKYGKGVVWKQFRGFEESLKFTEMKIRPSD